VGSALAVLLAGTLAGCGGSGTMNYGTITTLAGTGTPGYTGDGGPAAKAQLGAPSCVAVDAAGDVFIGDSEKNVVREVNASGTISTYAGTGTAGYSGDGGPATAAELYAPTACAVDSAGDLYVADDANNVVRKIDTKGVITTVAGNGADAGTPNGEFGGDGGAATAAELNHPFGVAVDAAGNLYIADTVNYRVRKVDAASGVITTIAGNGTFGYAGDGKAATSAELYNPEGLAVDAAGDVYIADQANNVVRKVDASGTISTVAGRQKQYGFSGDGGAATSADLSGPTAVVLDSAGNLYISDTGNMRVRSVMASNGVIHAVAGDGTQGFKGDGGKATDAELNNPHGITFDKTGNMFIADYTNGAVRKVTP
jgi:sugar lactone lactonase YvrE